MNIRAAQLKDIPRIAEIIVFGKRVAYRPIFQNDEVSFNELQVLDMLEGFKCDKDVMKSVYKSMEEACEDTGFTYSNFRSRCSVMVIHKASSIGEFINTFEHEKNHLEMHMCEALDINPYSEEAAHMSGNLAQTILEEALSLIVEL